MEWRHLRYFVAVAENLSFRGAAQKLNVSQPALSKQIRDLEEECGVRLFNRNTSRVLLTDAGAVLLDEAREVLQQAARLPRLAREAADGRRGRLIVGNVSTLTTGYLPTLLAAFHRKFPEAEVSLLELQPWEQVDALRERRIHVGFFPPPRDIPTSDLVGFETLRSPFAVFVAQSHPLGRKRHVSLADLSDQVLLAATFPPSVDHHVAFTRDLFTNSGVALPRIRTVEGVDSLYALVGSNQGAAIMPQVAIQHHPSNLRALPLRTQGTPMMVSLWCYRRANETSLLVQHFVSVVESRRRKPVAAPTKNA
jgi:DNA-binding transcriptional LysR family regulator